MVVPKTRLTELNSKTPLLFVFSPSPDHRYYQMQMEQLDSIRLAVQDSRLMIAEIFEQGDGHIGRSDLSNDSCTRFREKFNVHPGQFKVFLVGSDSEVHLVSEDCISWQELMMRVDNVARNYSPMT
jgi:hypothetical protein